MDPISEVPRCAHGRNRPVKAAAGSGCTYLIAIASVVGGLFDYGGGGEVQLSPPEA
jgi:hypothetical protein